MREPKQTRWSRKQIMEGKCGSCGAQCFTNARTGRNYSLCDECRPEQNKRVQRQRDAKKAKRMAGQAEDSVHAG